jgi:hypothetical protein
LTWDLFIDVLYLWSEQNDSSKSHKKVLLHVFDNKTCPEADKSSIHVQLTDQAIQYYCSSALNEDNLWINNSHSYDSLMIFLMTVMEKWENLTISVRHVEETVFCLSPIFENIDVAQYHVGISRRLDRNCQVLLELV